MHSHSHFAGELPKTGAVWPVGTLASELKPESDPRTVLPAPTVAQNNHYVTTPDFISGVFQASL